MTRIGSLIAAAALVAAGVTVVRGQGAPAGATGQVDPLVEKARKIHREAIVVDTHIDTTEHLGGSWKFGDRHPAPPGGGDEASSVDLPRMREGGVDAAFFSVWVPGTITGPKAVSLARDQFDRLKGMVGSYPSDLLHCVRASDVRQAQQEGKVGVLIGVEGGTMINNDLEVLRDYARMGARYLTLTHMVNVGWADSSSVPPQSNGLTEFGRKVVAEMNRLGMIVDVSHASDKTFWDVLEASQSPVIASHSSCRALCDHPRNLTDEMIKALAAKGGVIQINFYAGYVDEAFNREDARRQPQLEKLRADLEQRYPGPANEATRRQELRAASEKMGPMPVASWERIVDHIDHAVKLVGPEHVGLGSDFDGARMPQGMEDCAQLPKITEALLRKGYKEQAIKLILGGNTLRVMEENERIAKKLGGN